MRGNAGLAFSSGSRPSGSWHFLPGEKEVEAGWVVFLREGMLG